MRKIRFYRLLKKYSQTELGLRVGVAQSKISLLEYGKIKVSSYVLEKIKKVLDFPEDIKNLTDHVENPYNEDK